MKLNQNNYTTLINLFSQVCFKCNNQTDQNKLIFFLRYNSLKKHCKTFDNFSITTILFLSLNKLFAIQLYEYFILKLLRCFLLQRYIGMVSYHFLNINPNLCKIAYLLCHLFIFFTKNKHTCQLILCKCRLHYAYKKFLLQFEHDSNYHIIIQKIL